MLRIACAAEAALSTDCASPEEWFHQLDAQRLGTLPSCRAARTIFGLAVSQCLGYAPVGTGIALLQGMRWSRPIALLLSGTALIAASTTAKAEQGSLGGRCPAYAEHLGRARTLITNDQQQEALAELHWAKEALSECIRLEAEIEGVPTMLASAAPGEADGRGTPVFS